MGVGDHKFLSLAMTSFVDLVLSIVIVQLFPFPPYKSNPLASLVLISQPLSLFIIFHCFLSFRLLSFIP